MNVTLARRVLSIGLCIALMAVTMPIDAGAMMFYQDPQAATAPASSSSYPGQGAPMTDNTIHGGVSGSSNNNAFAMEFGGGLDFALTKNIQARPVEVDYLYTRFGINGTSYTGAQNNFKYLAGVNFTFGGK